jgi:4-amino-4-deoxychorismate lyase
MCLLLETIKVRDNVLQQVQFHNFRVNDSRTALFGATDKWDLGQLLRVPDINQAGIYRCRFVYNQIVRQVEFLPYSPRRIKKLKLIHADDLDYSYKYADRHVLEMIRKQASQDEDSDILIIKNGLITDTSFSNIAFSDGNHWYTPALPLLKGTKRAFYIASGMILEKNITPADLNGYNRARLINAMLDLEESEDISVENIR